MIAHYANDPHSFNLHGKPVIFFAAPIFDNGRTLSTWAFVRSQADPQNQELWSAEGTDLSALSVFDSKHLFSAGDFGILHGDMAAVDQGFRNQIRTFNEWFEGAMIEPSIHYGTLHLDLTTQYAKLWRG